MKNAILFIFISAFTISAFPQINYEKEITVNLEEGYYSAKFISLGENGFLLYSSGNETKKGNKEWKYDFYDVEMNFKKSVHVSIDENLWFVKTTQSKENINLIFRDDEVNYSIISISLSDYYLKKIDGRFSEKLLISSVVEYRNIIFLNLDSKKSQLNSYNTATNLVAIDLEDGEQKIIPIKIDGYKESEIKFIGFQSLEKSNELFVYLRARQDMENSELYILRLDEKAEKKEIYKLFDKAKQNVISISAVELELNKYIFTGSFSKKAEKIFNSKKAYYPIDGLFFCQTTNYTLDFINYYDFTNLKNIVNRFESKGKFGAFSNYLQTLQDGFLHSEVLFVPEYSTTSVNTATTNAGDTRSTHQIPNFNGFKITKALLIKFDRQGNIIWDQNFKLFYTPQPLSPGLISIANSWNNKIEVAVNRRKTHVRDYKRENKAISLISYNSDDGELIESFKYTDIEFTSDDSKLNPFYTSVYYWYNDYFITFSKYLVKQKGSKYKKQIYAIKRIKL